MGLPVAIGVLVTAELDPETGTPLIVPLKRPPNPSPRRDGYGTTTSLAGDTANASVTAITSSVTASSAALATAGTK